MTQVIEPTSTQPSLETDLVTAVQNVLQQCDEPQTLSKIRARLPLRMREVSLEELTAILNRQIAAQVAWQFPKYRSQQDRYWDRPMAVHLESLLRSTLSEGAMGWSELRRRLPAYAQTLSEEILEQMLAKGQLHRHPRMGRTPEHFGVTPADPRDYLRSELNAVFARLEPLGFHKDQLRAATLELLHEEEWASIEPTTPESTTSTTVATVVPDEDAGETNQQQ